MVAAFQELFAYRTLIQTLVMRDLKARYRGSALGLLWTLMNPLLHMAIYVLIFSVYMRNDMERYAAFLLCGLLPWIWLSSSLLLYGVTLGWSLFALPLIMAAQFGLTLGLTLTASAASVRYRDIPLILGHLLTFWFFLSPIIYPATQVPERFRAFLALNPFASFVV